MTTPITDGAGLQECCDGVTRPIEDCVQTHDGRWIDVDSAVTVDGDVCHVDDDDICYVPRHSEYHWTDNCSFIDDEWELDCDCTCCQSCGDLMVRRTAYIAPGGGLLCRSCFDDQVSSCSECGDEVWRSDLDDDLCCENCPGGRLIANYSDKTANRLRSESKDKLRFGIELEVEGYDSAKQAAEYIRRFLPDTYCVLKRDGSLGESGVEIVTRPDSIAVHKRMLAGFFKDSPGRALSSWNTGRCGMHVHVSRAALSELQIGKMLCFLNEPAAVNFISKIAGRAPCHWCKVHKKKLSDVFNESDRYTALNVTNSNTVEVRIFKGTLKEEAFMKNLEFVQALVEFTSPASRSIAEATSYRAFCDWLPRKAYPNLFQFLVSKGFIRRRNAA